MINLIVNAKKVICNCKEEHVLMKGVDFCRSLHHYDYAVKHDHVHTNTIR